MYGKPFRWEDGKNEKLKRERGVSFEMVIAAAVSGHLLGIRPNKGSRPHQKVAIVLIKDYVHVVPFVEDTDHVFLKTIYPDSKLHKEYMRK